MKAKNPEYTEPSPRQTKALCAKVSEAVILPAKHHAQFLIKNPGVLQARLDAALLYRPAVMARPQGDSCLEVAMNLMKDGLVVHIGHYHEGTTEIVIQNASSPAGVERVREMAAAGTAVIATVIEEDAHIFDGVENVFTFSGNVFSVHELERFARDVLFQIRNWFYCGPPPNQDTHE